MSQNAHASTPSIKRLLILASGSGSNFEAIAKAIIDQQMPLRITALLCDRAGAKVFERSSRLGVPAKLIDAKTFSDRASFDRALLQAVLDENPDVIALAGFMKILSKEMIAAFPHRIVNIHPSLLPAFPGLHAIQKAFAAKVPETGVTVHFVDDGMDTGPIIAQRKVAISADDTEESLEKKVHSVEHALYPEVLSWIANDRVEVRGNRVFVKEQDRVRS